MKEQRPLKLKTWNFNSLSDRNITFWYYQDSGRQIADKVLYPGLIETQELDAPRWLPGDAQLLTPIYKK